jgi:hypothetical protein
MGCPVRGGRRPGGDGLIVLANGQTEAMGAGLELFGRRRDGGEFPTEISLSSIETEGGTLAIAAIRHAYAD